MAERLFTNLELAAAIREKLTGTKALQVEPSIMRNAIDFACMELVNFGDEVGDSGWIWLYATAVIPNVTFNIGSPGVLTNPVFIPAFHRGIQVRLKDDTSEPIVLQFVSPREARSTVGKLTQSGDPLAFWISDYDPASDMYQINIYPIPTGITDAQIDYQAGIDKFSESPTLTSRVRWPGNLVEAIVCGAASRIFEIYRLFPESDRAKKGFLAGVDRAMKHHRVQMPQAGFVCQNELQIAQGQRRIGGMLRDITRA